MDYSYFPFDVNGTTSETQDEVDAIFTSLGLTAWVDILRTNDDLNPEYERGTRYLTPEEALKDIFDRGISSFSRILYFPDEDLYGIYIEYDA